MKPTHAVFALPFLLSACATGAGANPLGADLHELDAERYAAVAERHGVDPSTHEAFALHRDGRCADVYVRGEVVHTTEQQDKMTKLLACRGQIVR